MSNLTRNTYREIVIEVACEIKTLYKRINELIAANNAEVERRRAVDHEAMVAHFHRSFGVPVALRPTLDAATINLRMRLLKEEWEELQQAVVDGNLVEISDALADMEYIIHGTNLALGLNGNAVFREVHRSNMAKLGPDGKPLMRSDGKIIKPEGWQPPDVETAMWEGA